jgi:hypothetical protein
MHHHCWPQPKPRQGFHPNAPNTLDPNPATTRNLAATPNRSKLPPARDRRGTDEVTSMRDLSPPRQPIRAASILHDTDHHAKSPLAPTASQGSHRRCYTSLSMKLLEKAMSVPAQTAIHNEPPSVGCRSSCKPATDMRDMSQPRRSTRTAANPPSLAQRRLPRRGPATITVHLQQTPPPSTTRRTPRMVVVVMLSPL